MEGMPQLVEIITQLRIDVGRLHERLQKLDDIAHRLDDFARRLEKISQRAEEVENQVIKAADSTASAHKRLDKIDKYVFWISTLIFGAIVLEVIRMTFNQK